MVSTREVAVIDLRDRVIEAAAKSFSIFGYKGTTMDQVAKIAGVGKGTIYTFFSSKEDLFSYILNRIITEIKAIADSSIEPDSSFFDNLDRALGKILTFRKDHELLVKLVHEVREIGTTTVREGLAKVEEAIIDFIAKELEKGMSHGDLKPCDPKLTAFIMLRTYTSLVFEWEHIKDEEISAVFHLIFSEGLNQKQ